MRIFIIFIISATLSFAQLAEWEYYDDMQYPVAGADIWVNGEVFYVFGGYSDSLQSNVNWVQKYRVYYDVWKIFNMAAPRFGHVVNDYNNYAFVFGGVNSDYTNELTGLEQWDSSSGFDTTFSSNLNFNRNFSTAKIIGDNLYIIGGNPQPGTSSDTLSYIIEFNLIADSVTYFSDSLFINSELPEQQMAEIIGDDIFIFGGVMNGISQDIYKFNTVDKSFIKLEQSLIEPRAAGRAVKGTDPNTIYIIGGYNENNISLRTVEVFSFYTADNATVDYIPPINDARYNFMATYFDDFIYIMGGFDDEGKVVPSIERYNINAATTNVNNSYNDFPKSFILHQNYPNPFNPNTKIKYSIPTSDNLNVTLKVYNILGSEVAVLINQNQKPGTYEINFDASNFPSGVYYYKLKTDSFVQTKKMILLK